MTVLYKHIWTLGLFVALILAGCSSEQTASTDQPASTDSIAKPDTEMSGARIYLYDKSRVTAEINADKIVRFEAIDSTMAYTVDVDVFDSSGLVTTHVVGDSGIIRETTGIVHMYGDVVVVTEDSSRLESNYLYWDSKNEKITTDAFVRITKGDDIITGWGMEADQRLNRVKILKEVSGTINNPDELTEP